MCDFDVFKTARGRNKTMHCSTTHFWGRDVFFSRIVTAGDRHHYFALVILTWNTKSCLMIRTIQLVTRVSGVTANNSGLREVRRAGETFATQTSSQGR